jgi:arylformamidase
LKLYRNFNSQTEIDKEYNAISMVSDLNAYIDYDKKANAQVCKELNNILDVKYGPLCNETMDIFPAENKDAAVLVFVHGGYWRSMNSRNFSLVARGLVSRGVTVVIPNYSLCPSVSISEITRQIQTSVAWVYQNIYQFNGSPDRIFVGGHSAGGQQVGMLVSTNWENEYNIPKNVIKGGVPISGIFDLTPLYYSWLQPTILLNQSIILTQSPQLQIPDDGPPLLISVGENESSEFKRQSKDYHASWKKRGFKSELFIQSDKNHFTSFRDLDDPDSLLSNTVIKFIENCENN